MRSDFPRSPRLLKGALVVYESHTPGASAKEIPFQYNPEQVSRTVTHGRATTSTTRSRGEAQQDVLRVAESPRETFSLSIILNATDQLEEPEQNQDIVANGLHSALATMEMLLYPTTNEVLQHETRAERGEVQLNPADLPLTLLVWGRSRVLPVMITNFSVTEDVFDPRLNPIQAKVELSLSVLNDTDLPPESMGQNIYRAYQAQKEGLARQYRAGEYEEQTTGLLPG